MNPLHEQFIAEARDLIHDASDNLIALERDGLENERIDRIFRAFHTLKGAAGVVGLAPMSLMLHAAEDLLAAIQDGRIDATSPVVDGALACLDQLSRWVDDFAAREAFPSDAGQDANAMAGRLRGLALLGEAQISGSSREGFPSTFAAGVLPDWAVRLVEMHRAQSDDRVQESSTGFRVVSYEPRRGCFFDGDDPLALMRQVPKLLAFHLEARDPWPALAEHDPYACNLRLYGLSSAGRGELQDVFRLVPDQIRIVDVPRDAGGRQDDVRIAAGAGSLVRAIIEEQRLMLRLFPGGDDFIGRIGATMRTAANALRYDGKERLAQQIEGAPASAIRDRDVGPIVATLDDILDVLTEGSSAVAAAGEAREPSVDPETGRAESAASRSLRVEEAKIDRLVNLVGELLVVKNGFAHLARRLHAESGTASLAETMRREQDGLDRLVGEMHAAILQLRMVPVAQVFRLFPRLVRDMSRQLGKNVRLVASGETTESDKAIVDCLFEPLVHLVRNALDHGIEGAEQRHARAKPDTATLTLQASRAGDRFVVEVIDDGGGIDPAMVKRRAGERGLLTAEELAGLSEEQIIELVFAPGFSTSTEISDISGRGVGLDVVRTTIERVGGRVSIQSHLGIGTTVRLDLPVNIAVSRLMVVEAGGQVFGIPLDVVTETVLLTADRISRIKTNDGFVLRDRVVPICSLAGLMNLPARSLVKTNERLVIVTEVSGSAIALEVDAVRDRLEVILKPMQGLLSKTHGFSGTTLMGDGGVLLVLNLKELLP